MRDVLVLPIGLFKSIDVYFCTVGRRICMRLGMGVDSDRGVFEWRVDLFQRYCSYGRVNVVARRVVVLMCVVILASRHQEFWASHQILNLAS